MTSIQPHTINVKLYLKGTNAVMQCILLCLNAEAIVYLFTIFQNCLRLFIEMLHNLSPPHLSCFPLIPASGPPLHSFFLPSSASILSLFTLSIRSFPVSFSTPTLHCPPPLPGGWWPGTGTVQGILSDTIMRELWGTCCSSSNRGSPRNCITSR